MPRTSGISIQNNFSQGLITESTPLNFPKNAAVESDNVNFDYTGRVIRRQEIDLEDNYSVGSSLSFTGADYYTEYSWEQASDAGTFSFLVQQAGDTLHFYNTTSNNNLSQNKNANTVTLSTYAAADTVIVAATQPCQYSQGNGGLIVVNRGIDPILIKYSPAMDNFTVTKINIKWRDFTGLSTTYSDTQRPAFATLNDLLGNAQGVRHYYNLLNQGWWQGTISGGFPSTTSPLGMWDADTTSGSPAVGTFPSNSDYMGYYRASATVAFDADRLIAFQQGTTLAPKGHFILSLGNTDRRQAVINSGYTLNLSGTVGTFIPANTGTRINDGTGWTNANQAFDGVYNYSTSKATKTGTYSAGDGFLGKDLGSGNSKKVDSARWYGYKVSALASGEKGYGSADKYARIDRPLNPFNNSGYIDVNLELRASNTAPISSSSGTLLGTAIFKANQTSSFTQINSNDKLTTYRYIWVRAYYSTSPPMAGSVNGGSLGCAELELYESKDITNTVTYNDPEVTTERPQTCAYYAGRAWYGGVNSSSWSTTLFFSQIIENDNQYGKCYQQNDPTSEDFFELLDSDGGTIKIPEMGSLQAMFVYQTTLILLASNGVWTLRGNNGQAFKATDYVIRKISSQGTTSGLSIVDIQGIPYWFSDSGLLRINYNPQFDSFSIESITDTTIRSFYLSIPAGNRTDVKGDYDQYLQLAYWLYNDGTLADPYYNHILIYNNRTNGFFSWSTDTLTDPLVGELGDVPGIVGIKFIQDILGVSEPKLKLTTLINIDSSHQYITYSEIFHDAPKYYDWYKWANEIENDDTKKIDFSSYFVTNYELDGETQKFVQPNYVMLFLDQPYDSDGNRIEQSAYLRGIFDFAISGDTGKWSSTAQSSQQIFNENLPNRSVNFRRLKIRGKGRSLQFRVHSEPGMPFSIVGWSVWKTANSQD